MNRGALWLLVAMSQQHIITGGVGTAVVGPAAALGQSSPHHSRSSLTPMPPHSGWALTPSAPPAAAPRTSQRRCNKNRLLMVTATAIIRARWQPSTGADTERARGSGLHQHHTRVGSSRNCGRAAAAALEVLRV
jgi:hypothetical protein